MHSPVTQRYFKVLKSRGFFYYFPSIYLNMGIILHMILCSAF